MEAGVSGAADAPISSESHEHSHTHAGAPGPLCEKLEGLQGMQTELCGVPADPSSHRLLGTWRCTDHLEDELRGEM